MKTVWPAAAILASILAPGCASAPAPAPGSGEPQLIRVKPKTPGWPLAVLEEGLSSPDEAVRAQAAWELSVAQGVSERVYERLSEMITSDPSAQVRSAAAWASRADSHDTPPKVLRLSRPVYPQEAFVKKIQGTVELQILISETGTVTHAEIKRSIAGLDAAALTAVMAWTFEPARKGDRPVPSKAMAPVTFTIHK